MKDLVWNNLKVNKCPECNKDFMRGLTTVPVSGKGNLLAHECGFKIFERTYSRIVNSQITQEIEDQLNREYDEEGGDR